jgi:hypothetical protein
MEVNNRRHHAFIINRKICPPSILHQDLKIFDVLCDAPVAKAIGAVNIITPSKMYRSAASNNSLI